MRIPNRNYNGSNECMLCGAGEHAFFYPFFQITLCDTCVPLAYDMYTDALCVGMQQLIRMYETRIALLQQEHLRKVQDLRNLHAREMEKTVDRCRLLVERCEKLMRQDGDGSEGTPEEGRTEG